MNLEELYNQEKAYKKQSVLDEAAARAHLGKLIDASTSLPDIYRITVELSIGTAAEEIMRQAAGLVKPNVWREDGYSITKYRKLVNKKLIYGGGESTEDKKHRSLELYVDQSFIHQYYWNDQSMHLCEMPEHYNVRTVKKKVLGIYDAEFNQMFEELEAPLKMAEKLKRGSQKYIKLRYEPEIWDGGWCDNGGMYLFADGHSYISRGSGYVHEFRYAFNEDNIEKTSRFIVEQIMKLNGD